MNVFLNGRGGGKDVELYNFIRCGIDDSISDSASSI
jgi:hypothetical protein